MVSDDSWHPDAPSISTDKTWVCITQQKTIWEMYPFGRTNPPTIQINLTTDVNWWYRLTTRLIFGWQWIKVCEK